MNLSSLFGVTSIVCFCLPIAAILYYRLYRHAGLIALMAYYIVTIFRCVVSSNIPPVHNFKNTGDVLYNFLEVPLVLTALLFFCPASAKQNKIRLLIGCFLAYEVMVAIVYGFTPTASLFITAPGLLLIVFYSLFLLLNQLKFTVIHGKNGGRALMLGSLLFSYSFYLFMFYTYFILKNTDIASIYLYYFVSSTIASVLMSIGLFIMRHRIRELQELKITRKELQMIFG